jgi:predicted 3-demethylubiquinone-9 3-methyltransferase (glyoxalase superfamily)
MALLQQKVRTCLWFKNDGLAAARFYTSLLPDSRVDGVVQHDDASPHPLVVEFTLAGCPMMILNGGDHFKLTPAASIAVLTQDQAETDHLWASLIADGGEESRCGWLTDRWGVSWQITPEAMIRLFMHEDRVAVQRAREAMFTMRKIDLATIEAAFHS